MRRKFDFSLGEFYHIYSRGVDKRLIFLNDYDKIRFTRLLFLSNGELGYEYRDFRNQSFAEIDMGEKLVAIGGYCLMDNHFHLIIKEISENGISRFMEKLLTAYSSYFNKVNIRKGRLFESTFQATHLNTDEYLKYIFAYVHLNPIKMINPNWREDVMFDRQSAKEFLENYDFSSYKDFIYEDREEKMILDLNQFPEYFGEGNTFKDFIKDWLNFKDQFDLVA